MLSESSYCFIDAAFSSGEKALYLTRMPTAKTWKMCSTCDTNSDCGCRAAIQISEEKQKGDVLCSLSHVRSISQLSAVSATSQTSKPNLIYQRRKIHKSPSIFPLSNVSANTSLGSENIVYQRRKLQSKPVTRFSAPVSATARKSSVNCISFFRSEDISSTPMEKHTGSLEPEATRLSSGSAIICSKEPPFMTGEAVQRCLLEDVGSDAKDKINKNVELYSVDDSCSSSLLLMDICSDSLKPELDDVGECSSSGALVSEVMREDLSEKDICISILRSHGLLSRTKMNSPVAFEEGGPSCSESSGSCSCHICGHSETMANMLICDHCEEAFHVACCNISVRKIPSEEWYCQSCSKKQHKIIKESAVKKSSIISRETGQITSRGQPGHIALMLEDSEPYSTGVRVGKGFQAYVPDWSGPITGDIDAVPEPLELTPSFTVDLPELNSGKGPRPSCIGNWLQCRDIITGVGEGIDGTVCGKWRRAPLFEVQTDDWDCFRSVLWDPSRSDCAAPQELETEEIMKQLKYIEMLRPRLAAKRQKLEPVDARHCTDPTDTARAS